jgi:hypothetical protein
MRTRTIVGFLLLTLLACGPQPPAARAAPGDWTPAAWTGESTLELGTQAPGEAPYWFPVWLVVLDGQLYVRLGNRAAGRVEQSTTRPVLGVRVAGKEFPRVKGEPAPDAVDRVAAAMREKYTTDVFVRWMEHPLTLRLVPE